MPVAPQTFRPAYMGERRAREQQRQKDQAKWRGSAASRGYGARWTRYRAGYLRDNPLCVCCAANGVTTAAVVLDHVKDAQRYPELFWEAANHQGLCRPCDQTIKAPIERKHRAGLAEDWELRLDRPMPDRFIDPGL